MIAPALAEHHFRHEHGRLVAILVRRFGASQLERVEDAVQSALLAALETWPTGGVPEQPTAWLHRVAHRRVLDGLRAELRHARAQPAMFPPGEVDEPIALLSADVRDELLRLLFVVCDGALPPPTQLVVALKVLCGFEVREISERLLLTEANVYKRLSRGRARLAEVAPTIDALGLPELRSRIGGVRSALYLLFTEGHLSSHPETALRRELCAEAIRLSEELAEHPALADPETDALVALLHLHAARLSARADPTGELQPFDEQDRERWDRGEIARGLAWLARSARGAVLGRYHLEAEIAAEHCLAPTFAETRWERIAASYAALEQQTSSPLHALGQIVAHAHTHGAAAALARLEQRELGALAGSHALPAVRAYLLLSSGRPSEAAVHRDEALRRAPSEPIRAALQRRLGGR